MILFKLLPGCDGTSGHRVHFLMKSYREAARNKCYKLEQRAWPPSSPAAHIMFGCLCGIFHVLVINARSFHWTFGRHWTYPTVSDLAAQHKTYSCNLIFPMTVGSVHIPGLVRSKLLRMCVLAWLFTGLRVFEARPSLILAENDLSPILGPLSAWEIHIMK